MPLLFALLSIKITLGPFSLPLHLSILRCLWLYIDLYIPGPVSIWSRGERDQTLLKCFQICLDSLKYKEVGGKIWNKACSSDVCNKSGAFTRKQWTTINKYIYICSERGEDLVMGLFRLWETPLSQVSNSFYLLPPQLFVNDCMVPRHNLCLSVSLLPSQIKRHFPWAL